MFSCPSSIYRIMSYQYVRPGSKKPIKHPTRATTTRISITWMGDLFFLAINHQQRMITTAVRSPGKTSSSLDCRLK